MCVWGGMVLGVKLFVPLLSPLPTSLSSNPSLLASRLPGAVNVRRAWCGHAGTASTTCTDPILPSLLPTPQVLCAQGVVRSYQNRLHNLH